MIFKQFGACWDDEKAVKNLGMKLADLHIRHHDDGTYTAVWGPFLLKSGYQPIFKMSSGPVRIGAFEALCRPIRQGVPTSPGKFFPLVPKDESYLVELQTRAVHVLNAPAVLTGKEWLFLNFDPSMFTSRGSINDALAILNETLGIAGVERKRIVCEVTEHKTDEAHLMALVGAMRDSGFKVAVDDYGADDSDMERVRKLLPDIIKFDAYWITRLMDSGTAGAELLKGMVNTFRDRGIITLFEGIEEGWQLDLAVDCNVDFIQGYVLAKPQTVPTNFHDFRAKLPGAMPNSAQSALPTSEVNRFAPVPAAKPPVTGSMQAWDQQFSALMETPVLPNVPSLVPETPQFSPGPTAQSPGYAPARRPQVAFGKRTR
jgi:EAL domain-containing protein (putative c-di-GMP-specific phosphodiesterase class I)